jgi:hypothetical protein
MCNPNPDRKKASMDDVTPPRSLPIRVADGRCRRGPAAAG